MRQFDLSALLSECKEPITNKTLAEMNFAWQIAEDDQRTLQVRVGFPINDIKDSLHQLIQQKLQEYTQENWQVVINSFIRSHQTQMAGKSLRGVKNTIAVASGKGGVGKSTVTINLAAALAKAGATVGILDADIYGPSIPLMLGKNKPVTIENDKYQPVQAHGIQAMSIGYLTEGEDQALIWRGPMLAKALLQMLDITLWQELDYLFIDLPPGTGDIQLSLVQKIPLTGAVIVTTPQEVATLDAKKAIELFAKTNIDVLGIVENMSTHVCSHCGEIEEIFGSGGAKNLAAKYDVPLIGQWPLDKTIRMHCDAGQPAALSENRLASIFANSARDLSLILAKKPLNYADKFPPIVVE